MRRRHVTTLMPSTVCAPPPPTLFDDEKRRAPPVLPYTSSRSVLSLSSPSAAFSSIDAAARSRYRGSGDDERRASAHRRAAPAGIVEIGDRLVEATEIDVAPGVGGLDIVAGEDTGGASLHVPSRTRQVSAV